MSHETELNKINNNYKIVQRFMGGMSNFTYKIQDEKGTYYVFRFPGKGNYNFVNYEVEEEHLKEIEALNISNKVVHLDVPNGIKVATYIEGENISTDIKLQKVSQVLKTLHNSNVKFKSYAHIERLNKYESLHTNNVEKYDKLRKKWLQIYEKYLKEHIKYPCHNDSQMANFILTPNNEVKLLDWEYAGVNDYIYDIACFGNVDFNMAKKLLYTYEEEVTNDKMIRLVGWRMFQCLQWFNVASYKEEIGLSKDLNVDFAMVSNKYVMLAEKFLNELNELIR